MRSHTDSPYRTHYRATPRQDTQHTSPSMWAHSSPRRPLSRQQASTVDAAAPSNGKADPAAGKGPPALTQEAYVIAHKGGAMQSLLEACKQLQDQTEDLIQVGMGAAAANGVRWRQGRLLVPLAHGGLGEPVDNASQGAVTPLLTDCLMAAPCVVQALRLLQQLLGWLETRDAFTEAKVSSRAVSRRVQLMVSQGPAGCR